MQRQFRKLSKCMVLISLIFSHHLYPQTDGRGQDIIGVQDIFAEVFALRSDQSDKGRVDIYVQIPYPAIKFVKEDERYIGRIDISATLQINGQQAWQKNQLMELDVKEFAQTVSSRYSNLKQFSTDLPPGAYELILQVTDQETKKVKTLKKLITVKDFGKDTIALSDIMLVHRVNIKGMQKEIIPNLTGIIGKESASFYLFFEIYNRIQIDSVKLQCKFLNSKKEKAVLYLKNESLPVGKKQIIWQIDSPALSADQHSIMIEAEGSSKSIPATKLYAKVSRNCVIRMKGLPATITDLDKAIDQLIYIANGSEINNIREAVTSDEKKKRFLEFWAKRDPDPKTPENELMEEYYSRVDYANKNYSGFMEGWKTDMGMILIRFGMPENIERHPFNAENKPYEIWYYYNQNREFIFIDDTGFGDYRLQYPTTDMWGRIR